MGHSIEQLVERLLLASRWILVAFYLGLAAGLLIYAVSFGLKLLKIAQSVTVYSDEQMILAMLALIDAALVASLTLMVMISSYEYFVSRFDEADKTLPWLGKYDSGTLKVKVASAIVAISSIHLLQVFLNSAKYSGEQMMWLTVIHLSFVVSAIALGFIDGMGARKLPQKDEP